MKYVKIISAPESEIEKKVNTFIDETEGLGQKIGHIKPNWTENGITVFIVVISRP